MFKIIFAHSNVQPTSTKNKKQKKNTVAVGDTSSINIQHIIQQHQLKLEASQSSLCWHLLLLTQNHGHASALSVHIDFKFKSTEFKKFKNAKGFHSSTCTLKFFKCNSK